MGKRRAAGGQPSHTGLSHRVDAARAAYTIGDVPRGDVPSATAVPKGRRFAPRCRFAEARCREVDPPLAALPDGSAVACLPAAEGTLPVGG
jgi:oligopeptide/dipeptide ABC transporter ATP-binding protein